jgi:hypothetical protein
VSVASCRVLPAPSIGSCRAGVGAGVPAIFWTRWRAGLILETPVWTLFDPRVQLTRWPHFKNGFEAAGGDALRLGS